MSWAPGSGRTSTACASGDDVSASVTNRAESLGRAWGWVDHLRAGGTTAWCESTLSSPSRGGLLPGAIQLEVARRVNLAAGPTTARHAGLIGRILETSAPGRGQPDLELVGLHSGTPFGPRPVDPTTLPEAELLRMAVGVLAELVVEHDPGPDLSPPGGSPGRSRWPWRRGYAFHGDPLVGAGLRSALVESGHAPGRRSSIAVIVADDVATMLADVWQWRVEHNSNPSWRRFLATWPRRDNLPRVLDLPRTAANQSARLGADRVHIVLGDDPAPEVSRLLGVRALPEPSRPRLSADAVEVVRQVNLVLRVMVTSEVHQRLLDTVLLPWLSTETGRGPALGSRHREWVRRTAEQMRDELRAAGYSVHGDLDTLIPAQQHPSDPRSRRGGSGPTNDGVLDVALRTLLQVKEIES